MNHSTLPHLYQPSATEITHVTESAAHRHPTMTARIDKARDILINGSLQLDVAAWERCQVARWRIASQSHNGAYVVVGMSCPCDDCRRNRVAYCKHSIAVSLYLKVLTNRFNANVRNREIDLGVEDANHLHAYAPKMGYVQVQRLGNAYTFSDAASAVRYSMWLAKSEEAAQVSDNASVVELKTLASEEGLQLPMPANMIAFFERQGYVIDLQTGEALKNVTVELSPNHKALSHLYGISRQFTQSVNWGQTL